MYTSIALLAASAGLATAATSYKASFTQYGSTDTWGSGNCNVATTACGFYTSVRLLLLLFLLSPFPISFSMLTYLTARLLSRSIPKRIRRRHRRRRRPSMRHLLEINRIHRFLWQQFSNPLCAQNGLTGTNQYGANLNFDLCIDSGASAALFGSTGVGLAVGSAEQVDCSSWSGKVVS